MKWKLTSALAGVGMMHGRSGPALAAGELHIFNWGNYTNPELIKKFEAAHDVKVTLDGYDSNDAMLAKVKAGGSGYDIVVPSDYMVKIMIEEGLLLKTEPNKMSNFKQHEPGLRRRLFRSGPQLHGAMAVGHDRHFGQHGILQG